MIQSFDESSSKGIALGGRPGDPVVAAADGRVIFSGNGPRGYGNLVIVKHANDLLSVYAHNRSLAVKEGQDVRRGQKIAELGDSGATSPRLHFEIRQQGKPVDPMRFLPRR
jgi:lipoprotein NlpD